MTIKPPIPSDQLQLAPAPVKPMVAITIDIVDKDTAADTGSDSLLPYTSPRPSALEMYWPLMAVTLCSLYAITIVPFIAPGLFLAQYYLLRYIRQKKGLQSTTTPLPLYRTRPLLLTAGGSRLTKPTMETIPESESESEEDESDSPASPLLPTRASSSPSLPLAQSPRRPPPLTVPEYDMGYCSEPVPYVPFSHTGHDSSIEMIELLRSSSQSNDASLPLIPCIARQSSQTLGRSQSLSNNESQLAADAALSTAMDVLKRQSSETLMAATAALFSPTLLQSLAIRLTADSFNLTDFSSPAKLPPLAPSSRTSGRSQFSFTRELPLSPVETLTRIYTQQQPDLYSHTHAIVHQWNERALSATIECV